MEQSLKDFLAQAKVVQEQLAADHRVLTERRKQNTQDLVDWYYNELQKIKESLRMIPDTVQMEHTNAEYRRIKEVHEGAWYLEVQATDEKYIEVYLKFTYTRKKHGCVVAASFDKPHEYCGSCYGSIKDVPYDILKACYEKYPDLNVLAEQEIVKAIEYATRKQCEANNELTR